MASSAKRLLGIASTSLLLAATPTLAGEVKIKSITESGDIKATIKVKSADGKSYHTVDSGPLQFGFQVCAGCSWATTNNNREVKVTIGSTTEDLDLFEGVGKGFSDCKNYTIATPYMSPNITPSPVAACNARLQELVAQGKPSWKVMQDGFEIVKGGAYQAKLTVKCGGGAAQDTETASTPLTVRIQCMPSSLAKPPTHTPTRTATNTPTPAAQRTEPLGGKISSVSLKVEPTNYKGKCPTNIKFQAHIVPAAPINLKWRIEGDNGYQSPDYALNITTSTPKNPSTFRTIQRPSTMGQLTTGGPTKLPLIHGWAQLRVWAQGEPGFLRSAKVPFTVDCNPPSPAVGGSVVAVPTKTPKGFSAGPTPRHN
jgi:hypothetical protein